MKVAPLCCVIRRIPTLIPPPALEHCSQKKGMHTASNVTTGSCWCNALSACSHLGHTSDPSSVSLARLTQWDRFMVA